MGKQKIAMKVSSIKEMVACTYLLESIFAPHPEGYRLEADHEHTHFETDTHEIWIFSKSQNAVVVVADTFIDLTDEKTLI